MFYNPFSKDQKRLLQIIADLVKYGGQNAEAAPRGDGKTTLMMYAGFVWAIVYQHISYGVIVGASAQQATDSIMLPIKELYATPGGFAEDFPEFCVPISDVIGHAKNQIVAGQRTAVKWSGSMFVFPTVAGTSAQGQVITTRGLDSAVRGLVYKGKRPDLILVDDPQTDESAKNPTEVDQRKKLIETSLLGLAGPGQKLGVMYLGTVIRKNDLTDQLTNRSLCPAWRGKKQRFVEAWPKRLDLWEQYQEIQEKELNEDENSQSRKSHAFYLENQKAMDLGVKVNNPYRYDGTTLADGTQKEVSPIQHAYNKIRAMGEDAFNSDLQNDPPEDQFVETIEINIAAICRKLNGQERGVVPAGYDDLTVGIDVGGRVLHYTVAAWKAPYIGAVIDYGVLEVYTDPGLNLTEQANKDHAQQAVLKALMALWQEHLKPGFAVAGQPDELRHIGAAFVDSGWLPDAVYQFCRLAPQLWPSKGWGTTRGLRKYTAPIKRRLRHWYKEKIRRLGIAIINCDADHYKNQLHWGFLTADNRPGSLSLYGSDPFQHKDYARQILAERWEKEYSPGKGFVQRFVTKSRRNHFLDSTYLAAAAAAGLGHALTADTEAATA